MGAKRVQYGTKLPVDYYFDRRNLTDVRDSPNQKSLIFKDLVAGNSVDIADFLKNLPFLVFFVLVQNVDFVVKSEEKKKVDMIPLPPEILKFSNQRSSRSFQHLSGISRKSGIGRGSIGLNSFRTSSLKSGEIWAYPVSF